MWQDDARQPPYLRQLVDALRHPDPARRYHAAEQLAAMGQEAALALHPLQTTLYDQDIVVASMAAEAIGALGPLATLSIPILLRHLRGERDELRRPLAQALIQIGQPSIVPLLTALHDHNPAVRLIAAQTFGKFGKQAQAVVPQLRKRLAKETNQQVQSALQQALQLIEARP